jgi:adenosylcobinamide-phosphate synthase
VLLVDHALWVVVVAILFDAVIGDPDVVWRKLPHPVVWIGNAIGFLERELNVATWSPQQRKLAGVGAVLWLLIGAGIIGLLIEIFMPQGWIGIAVKGFLASILLAQRSLYQHVARVRDAFGSGGLIAARKAVAMIVGRDPEQLDEPGVSRAAIESTAENFSDGIVAPVFWLALFGLPGLIAYKAVNTADSMIGHRSERYESFGWAAARLDDLFNIIPARLSGILILLVAPVAGGSIATSKQIMFRDAANHRSPNAGWPESAMAGALGVALSGPRRYAEGEANEPWLNGEARKEASARDIGQALKLFVAACALQAAIYAALAFVL